MLSAQRKRELLHRATEMATQLGQGSATVTRAELRPVLNVLFLTPGPWSERLTRARQLLETLPESWVARRSGKTRPQLAHARSVLRGLLRSDLAEEEARFLLGWLARLVQISTAEKQVQVLTDIDRRRSFRPDSIGAPDSTTLIRENRDDEL